MTGNQLLRLLYFYKALADETRLKMVGLMLNNEHNVGQLAEKLNLTEPTVSHHLSKLRTVGLVNMRASGNQRFYRLNTDSLKLFQRLQEQLVRGERELEQGASDSTWIEELDIEDWERKVLRDYTFNGRLKQIPTKQLKLLVVLDWLASQFEAGRTYTEKEVHAVLLQYHEDFASLRRDLIEFGYMRRERGGSKYWLTPEDEGGH
jgi:biotin operon repressor